MQLSPQRGSWEFVQAVTWGKLYSPSYPPSSSILHRHYFHFSLFLPTDRYMFRHMYEEVQCAFSATGGRRSGNQLWVLIVLGFVLTLQNLCFPFPPNLKDVTHIQCQYEHKELPKTHSTTSVLLLHSFKFWLNSGIFPDAKWNGYSGQCPPHCPSC